VPVITGEKKYRPASLCFKPFAETVISSTTSPSLAIFDTMIITSRSNRASDENVMTCRQCAELCDTRLVSAQHVELEVMIINMDVFVMDGCSLDV
jgi:hypothetical protein